MSVTKVVKVEDVAGTRSSPCDDLFNPDTPTQTASKSNSIVTFTNEDSSSIIARESPDGAEDKQLVPKEELPVSLYPLPENWPQIPQLDGRRSCELTNSTLPCVNKAVSHLQLLQNIINDWFIQAEEEIKSRKSSRRQSVQSELVAVSPQKKQLRFSDERELTPSKKTDSIAGSVAGFTLTGTPDSTSQNLSIQGVGAKLDESIDIVEPVDDEAALPYLGAEDVVEEIITLLARLEKDRQETEAEWKREKGKVSLLTQKIDGLCLKRLRELPAIVQREHEACILDLNELQWHVAYCSRSEARIKDRKEIAEVLNARLKEDIAFVKRHIPLVQEKLLLELEAMDKIKKAQQETNQELEMTKQRQTKTEIKNLEANNKAETERGHIKQELDTVRDNLSQINEELVAAKMTHSAYVQQINDIEDKLKSNTQELLILEVKRENACDSAEHHNAKVKSLHEDIEKEGIEYNRLQNENIFLEKELNTTKNRIAHEVSKLTATVKQLEGKIRTLHLQNQEADMEIQDGEDKIHKYEKQKIADEKNMARIEKEMTRTATIMNATIDEYNQVALLNLSIKEQLSNEEEKIFRLEETLKNTIETLTRQVKDEIHNRTVLQARINSDNTEIDRTRIESAKKQDKAGKVAEDVDTAVNTVLTKVERLRSSKEENEKLKVNLADKIEETKKQHKESRDRFLERLTEMEPHHVHLKEDVKVVNKKIEHMTWRTEMMTKNIEDMDASEGMMNRVVGSTEKAIKHHTEDLKELNIQLESSGKIENDLTQAFNEVQDRIYIAENRHSKFLEERKNVLKQTEMAKTTCLANNKDLAAKYRQLQNEYIINKEKLLNSYEERIKYEKSLSDLRQLKCLQKKMHGALTELYKLSGKYNDAELARMEIEASRNGAKVEELQDEMNQALTSITHFLQTQMDGTAAKKMALEALQKKSTGRRTPVSVSGSNNSSRTPKHTVTAKG
ncbi:coiled-coil domain-containing protein 178 [Patella vulgata]|uniref:coiled-coil domain-containing protein 178 n=1 Tax=Patella vulgata TaxID=6465 RepID=UPI00217F729B|nr:coiled-coil domain-containing protein 178 [Patella vulgata]XP_050402302.1 coiled-coil domain-containing protein 178 [Patella vulgata]